MRITAYRVQLLKERSVSPRGRHERPEDVIPLFRAYAGFPDREHLKRSSSTCADACAASNRDRQRACAGLTRSPREGFKPAMLPAQTRFKLTRTPYTCTVPHVSMQAK